MINIKKAYISFGFCINSLKTSLGLTSCSKICPSTSTSSPILQLKLTLFKELTLSLSKNITNVGSNLFYLKERFEF